MSKPGAVYVVNFMRNSGNSEDNKAKILRTMLMIFPLVIFHA